ncbi:uncharacterized protein TRIADDRAFT_61853 [Trichoplax adhaerens]|uniref:PH domain-containing protein n=1 Tax=Trichoplax adhaerens TaxID=10228 RepID=B3SC63_TRIAD|nr:hypothetical protein TRIADDRAFT_61853 [Trichoplax adhaerens]EDV19666.1 hypothetical protein TRIADDRAFT_61853 [Trichoplax adhaerens]|eukprot:XP_002117823.1 hypothetical protein TRIADDRAFT_61853 [Trichoplax adhaerens]
MSYPQVAREGYLQRLTTILKRWKSSYCYLYHTGEFVYHESHGGNVDGRIYTKKGGLAVYSGISYQSPRKPEGVDYYSMLVFVENNGTETYFLCKDAEDARQWKAALDYQLGNGTMPQPGTAYPGAAPPPAVGSGPAPPGFTAGVPPPYPGQQPSTTYPSQPPSAYPKQPPSAYPTQPQTAYPTQPPAAYPAAGQPPVVGAQYPSYPATQVQYPGVTPTNVASTTTVHVHAGYPRRHGHSSVGGFGVGLALGNTIMW